MSIKSNCKINVSFNFKHKTCLISFLRPWSLKWAYNNFNTKFNMSINIVLIVQILSQELLYFVLIALGKVTIVNAVKNYDSWIQTVADWLLLDSTKHVFIPTHIFFPVFRLLEHNINFKIQYVTSNHSLEKVQWAKHDQVFRNMTLYLYTLVHALTVRNAK